MTTFALTITLNKFTKYFESINKSFTCSDLEVTKNVLINFIASHINHLTIDYPLTLEEFEYIWFDEQYVKCNLFSYNVFNIQSNEWINPWSLDEIYEDTLTYLHAKELLVPVNLSKLYGEPNPDEEEDDNILYDDFNDEKELKDNEEQMTTTEKTMLRDIKNIIKQSADLENETETKKVSFSHNNQSFYYDGKLD
jgi:hypothetical protein